MEIRGNGSNAHRKDFEARIGEGLTREQNPFHASTRERAFLLAQQFGDRNAGMRARRMIQREFGLQSPQEDRAGERRHQGEGRILPPGFVHDGQQVARLMCCEIILL